MPRSAWLQALPWRDLTAWKHNRMLQPGAQQPSTVAGSAATRCAVTECQVTLQQVHRDDVRDAAHSLPQHIVCHLKGVHHRHIRIHRCTRKYVLLYLTSVSHERLSHMCSRLAPGLTDRRVAMCTWPRCAAVCCSRRTAEQVVVGDDDQRVDGLPQRFHRLRCLHADVHPLRYQPWM